MRKMGSVPIFLQKARILLMLALTKTRDPRELQKIFETY